MFRAGNPREANDCANITVIIQNYPEVDQNLIIENATFFNRIGLPEDRLAEIFNKTFKPLRYSPPALEQALSDYQDLISILPNLGSPMDKNPSESLALIQSIQDFRSKWGYIIGHEKSVELSKRQRKIRDFLRTKYHIKASDSADLKKIEDF